ncbi:MAG: hypothetical protein IPL87_00840 [Candidatus Moraniibacteriota bacterium]|nr:MAG: hypothetical protein IPL87_00840 [Candidatus Moranbacteria bacterium]
MRFTIHDLSDNPVNLLRRAGYTFQRREGSEMSFVRPLAGGGYPRFHLYVQIEGECLRASFHLDQKRETYGDDTRHHGEYEESGILKQEAERIQALSSPAPDDSTVSPI